MNIVRNALMFTAAKSEYYEPGVIGARRHEELLKKNRNYLKHPLVLFGTAAVWVTVIGWLKPHSERISYAEHRFRIFLQGSTFVLMVTAATLHSEYLERQKKKDRH